MSKLVCFFIPCIVHTYFAKYYLNYFFSQLIELSAPSLTPPGCLNLTLSPRTYISIQLNGTSPNGLPGYLVPTSPTGALPITLLHQLLPWHPRSMSSWIPFLRRLPPCLLRSTLPCSRASLLFTHSFHPPITAVFFLGDESMPRCLICGMICCKNQIMSHWSSTGLWRMFS